MQIVIDIPEDVYTRLFDNGIQDNEIAVDDVCEMARAIRLGTSLPKGHWINTPDYLTCAYGCIDYVKCSECGEDSLEEGDFCPNCGAYMGGAE